MDKKINKLVKIIGKRFKENNLSLVTAESCTGGGLAFCISKEPECSAILERGFITYSNPLKENLLKVRSETIQIKGTVSREVALEMARGALKNSQAQVSIAITGIAGVDRGESRYANKPGMVWISCIDINGKEIVKNKHIKGGRSAFIETVIIEALSILLKYSNHFNK